ncbi:MAG: hypothetical protein IT328_05915 [Caldilineaceae bacterium]|nr:hypothetical protein [Caldilineaceae bacterium]
MSIGTMPPKKRGEYKPRLATTTKTHLDTIVDRSVSGHSHLREIVEWLNCERTAAKMNMDKARQARAGELSHAVAQLALDWADIERAAREARDGKIVDTKEKET